jgi:hypothetical protein
MRGKSSRVIRETCKKNTTGVSRIVNSFPVLTRNGGNRDQVARTLELGLDRPRELRTLDHRVEGLFRCEDRVEIGHVHGAADARFERRLDLLLREAPPVDLLKEWMALDLLCAVHAQTLCWVAR